MLFQPIPPAKKQIWNPSRYDPQKYKSCKNKAPQPISLTMK